jgi:hypothetical protein
MMLVSIVVTPANPDRYGSLRVIHHHGDGNQLGGPCDRCHSGSINDNLRDARQHPHRHHKLTVTTTSNGVPGVFTKHNGNGRTGQNLGETTLTPSNVNTSSFGKLFSVPVDGQIYAQPLYVPNVSITGATHNVVCVATEDEDDSVYAFNADVSSAPLWYVSLIDTAHGATPGETTENTESDLVPRAQIRFRSAGITSTPVIDPCTGTMYFGGGAQRSGLPPYQNYSNSII